MKCGQQTTVLRSRVGRRRFSIGALFAIAAISQPAFAGSYLNRAALLVRQATQEATYLRNRLSDRELARVVQKLAQGRLRAAREMLVPKEVAQAHPHLLLMLEKFERAAAAAAEREHIRFLTLERDAIDEEQIFRGILRQLGWPLPD